MKPRAINAPEWLYGIAFLVYLIGSSLAHIENGSELSLWIMTMALAVSMSVTVLPWLGIQWLRDDHHVRKISWWIALLIQLSSWSSFMYAVYERLRTNLPRFHTWLTATTLLWAAWLLIFLFTRTPKTHQQQPHPSSNTQREDS
jgi:multidrug efflux pump subunit AcrB